MLYLYLRDEEPKILMRVLDKTQLQICLSGLVCCVSLCHKNTEFPAQSADSKLAFCKSATHRHIKNLKDHMHHTETTICQIIFILHVSVMSGSDGMLVVLQLGKTSERPLLNTDSVSTFKCMKPLDIFKGAIVAVVEQSDC